MTPDPDTGTQGDKSSLHIGISRMMKVLNVNPDTTFMTTEPVTRDTVRYGVASIDHAGAWKPERSMRKLQRCRFAKEGSSFAGRPAHITAAMGSSVTSRKYEEIAEGEDFEMRMFLEHFKKTRLCRRLTGPASGSGDGASMVRVYLEWFYPILFGTPLDTKSPAYTRVMAQI